MNGSRNSGSSSSLASLAPANNPEPEGERMQKAGPDPLRWRALAVLGIAYLMVVLDVSIVNVALPSIQKDLHFHSNESLQWVVSGYALSLGGLLLLGGRSGDPRGRRPAFMAGQLFFSICSLIAG